MTNKTGADVLAKLEYIYTGQISLAEDIQRNDLIGPFILGNSIRAGLECIGGHIEYYLLTVVTK